MPVLGITGGIGTGKTTFTNELRGLFPAVVFDADVCARDLFEHDVQTQILVRKQFGDGVLTSSGEIDRRKVRDVIFSDEKLRRKLEEILHPVIRETWLRQAEKFKAKEDWLLVDIPLLFETRAEKFFQSIVVVACSGKVQQNRLVIERNLELKMALKIIAAQMPLSEKLNRAQHVIWNDGSLLALRSQSTLFLDCLINRHG